MDKPKHIDMSTVVLPLIAVCDVVVVIRSVCKCLQQIRLVMELVLNTPFQSLESAQEVLQLRMRVAHVRL